VADLREQLERGLADRYRIERELGRGGMATVYLAQDIRHKRPVALKVLHPELSATLGPERFQREIELAARLQHPHILSVHDSGEVRGAHPGEGPRQLWFTMPFVEGESLRERLNHQKQLPIEDALRITTEAARALDYAHRHGIIHRDIKPQNILLTKEGDTLVADFGIGRALDAADTEDKLTQTGVVVGTPAYMSPEQAAGERGLDGRSDLYSLGTVLYEMLAGEPPYTGPTAQAIMVRRFTGDVPRVREARSSVPEAVEQALVKVLARVPADRFQTAADFARALAPSTIITPTAVAPVQQTPVQSVAPAPAPAEARPGSRRVAALAFVLGLLVMASMGMFLLYRSHRATEDHGTGPKRLAVLPFENLGPAEDEYFADGVTDAVRGKLTSIPGLEVTARGSSTQYKKTPKGPQQIGQELGVQYILTGTVRWEKSAGGQSRVQVSPELIQVSTAAAKWQQPFDAPLTDVFQVQADIAGRVAQALDVALGAGRQNELQEKPTQNLTAYDAYLKGEEVSNALGISDPARLRQALGHYEKAVALDSGFALAWARVSETHSLLYFLTAPTAEDREAARAAAERALALAPQRPEGRLALGSYHYRVTRDYTRALEQFAVGQRVAPRDAELLVATALTEQTLGKWEAALQHLQEAQTIDPRSVNTARRLARTLLWLRRYPEALRVSDQGLALAPASLEILENKAMVYLAQGDLSGAQAVLRAAPKEVEPRVLVSYVGTYWDLAWALDEEQRRLLVRLPVTAFDDNRANWGVVLAQAYAVMGDRARTRAYADSGSITFEEQLRATPEDAQLHVLHGLALAYSGRTAEAIAEGEKGLALQPIAKDAYSGAYNQHALARIYVLAGKPDKALDQLEPLLRTPYYLSPAWLRIDPTFAPLRGNPRFERLVKGS
jgi:serine/threonine protein kinase/TolB-like protein/Flp pilus assembly protein TadD